MLRDRSPTETLFTYATFFALSVAIHMVLILGGRGEPAESPQGPQASVVEDGAQGRSR